jgi:hypothetical protein
MQQWRKYITLLALETKTMAKTDQKIVETQNMNMK